MQEPGLDRHEWETEWQGLEPLLADSPAEAIVEVDNLVARLMEARGFPGLVEAGEQVDPGDIGLAVTAYRNLYEYLVAIGPGTIGPG